MALQSTEPQTKYRTKAFYDKIKYLMKAIFLKISNTVKLLFFFLKTNEGFFLVIVSFVQTHKEINGWIIFVQS